MHDPLVTALRLARDAGRRLAARQETAIAPGRPADRFQVAALTATTEQFERIATLLTHAREAAERAAALTYFGGLRFGDRTLAENLADALRCCEADLAARPGVRLPRVIGLDFRLYHLDRAADKDWLDLARYKVEAALAYRLPRDF